MSEKIKKELEKNKKLKELEDSREDKFLEFIGGKIILYTNHYYFTRYRYIFIY